jgi:hypothetical protein
VKATRIWPDADAVSVTSVKFGAISASQAAIAARKAVACAALSVE